MAAEILRPYQEKGVAGVIACWDRGVRRVLLVCPTGGGKTVIASAFCDRELKNGGTVLFVVHRRELVKQTARRLRARFGWDQVGLVQPGEPYSPHADIQVGTVQSLLARGLRPDVSLVIFDEAHHYAADDWAILFHHYEKACLLGLTATPAREDGKPLGDLFDELIVAAKYSELLADGFLVPCAAYQPPQTMGGDLAQDPLVAYQRYAEGSQAFVFAASVEMAETLAKRFTEAGIAAACIEAKTPKGKRDETIAAFERGELRVITNVNTMTEGVDIPQARTVILARSFKGITAFLQAGGRVLRPDPWDLDRRPAPPSRKPYAILIDLVGATMQEDFGLPTDDRDYSLEGEGIKRSAVGALTTCASCGATYPSRPGGCPECNYVAPIVEKEQPKIWDLELKPFFAGAATPVDAKTREYKRLRAQGQSRGWSLVFVQKEYAKLFGERPVISDATEGERRAEFDRLRTQAEAKGYKPGFAKIRFKELFGAWPNATDMIPPEKT